jgi:hypothetical protein
MNSSLKQILAEIVDRLATTAASLDALEAALVENRSMTNDTVSVRFPGHKAVVESYLQSLRWSIAQLPE